MKFFNRKLNNKGFTLIELLAVIVILALVMVVTIPTVLNTMDKSKESTLQNAANAIAEWADKQNTLIPLDEASTAYTGFCGKTVNGCNKAFSATGGTAFIKAAGGSSSGLVLASSNIKFVNGRACVTLKANTSAGTYKGVANATKTSNGC